MSQSTLDLPFAVEAPEIDPRSFHVFEIHGDRLLFDRATGTTSSLSDIAYHLLRQIRWRVSPADAATRTSAVFSGVEPDQLLAALLDLKSRGFFRFTPVHVATETDLEVLWTHKPMRIQMLMAEGCNLGCRYCYQWRNGTNQLNTLMPWHVARTAVDYLVWRSAGRTDLQITFFGGEPLLNYPMIQRVVAYCKEIELRGDRRFVFELITNGTLLTPEVTNYLVEHRFLLFISLDGWKEMHNYNRPAMDGSPDTHDLIVRHATYANAQYEKHGLPKIKVRANLTNKFHDRGAVSSYFESLGFKVIGIGAIAPLPHEDASHAAMTEDQMDELEEKAWQQHIATFEGIESGHRVSAIKAKELREAVQELRREGMPGITCGVCRNTAVVDNRGNMYPCHRYGEMQAYRIGNVFTGLDRQLVMDYYKKVNQHATTECHDCWIRDYCGGGCAWELSDKTGKIHHPTNRECRRRRRGFKHSLWLRKEIQQRMPAFLGESAREALNGFHWKSAEGTTQMDQSNSEQAGNAKVVSQVTPLSLPILREGSSCCGSGNATDPTVLAKPAPHAGLAPVPAVGGCGCSDPSGSNCASCGTAVVELDLSAVAVPVRPTFDVASKSVN